MTLRLSDLLRGGVPHLARARTDAGAKGSRVGVPDRLLSSFFYSHPRESSLHYIGHPSTGLPGRSPPTSKGDHGSGAQCRSNVVAPGQGDDSVGRVSDFTDAGDQPNDVQSHLDGIQDAVRL